MSGWYQAFWVQSKYNTSSNKINSFGHVHSPGSSQFSQFKSNIRPKVYYFSKSTIFGRILAQSKFKTNIWTFLFAKSIFQSNIVWHIFGLDYLSSFLGLIQSEQTVIRMSDLGRSQHGGAANSNLWDMSRKGTLQLMLPAILKILEYKKKYLKANNS